MHAINICIETIAHTQSLFYEKLSVTKLKTLAYSTNSELHYDTMMTISA